MNEFWGGKFSEAFSPIIAAKGNLEKHINGTHTRDYLTYLGCGGKACRWQQKARKLLIAASPAI